MKRMVFGRIKATALVFCLLICATFFSCTQSKEDLKIFDGAFTMDIRWVSEGHTYNAIADVETKGNGLERDVRISVRSPSALEGCVFERVNGENALFYCGIRLGEAAAKEYVLLADAVSVCEGLSFSHTSELDGKSLRVYSSGGSEWYFNSSGLPCEIRIGEKRIYILSVEPK